MKFTNEADRTIRGMLNVDGTDRLEGSPDGATIQYVVKYRKGSGFVLHVQFGETRDGMFYFRIFKDRQLTFVLNGSPRNTAKAFQDAENILPRVLKDIAYGDYMTGTEKLT